MVVVVVVEKKQSTHCNSTAAAARSAQVRSQQLNLLRMKTKYEPGASAKEVGHFLKAFTTHIRTPEEFEELYGHDPRSWAEIRRARPDLPSRSTP